MTKKALFIPGVLAVFVLAAHFTTLNAPFLFDDLQYIQENPAVHTLSHFFAFWVDAGRSAFLEKNYVLRPLLFNLYALLWKAGGGATWPFHLAKLVMHWLVCLGVYSMWRMLFQLPNWLSKPELKVKLPWQKSETTVGPDQAAFFIALVLTIHTALTETVSYISATSSLFCAVFYVWSFIFYLKARLGNETANKALYRAVSLVLFLLSVATKEEGATLPLLIFLTELYVFKGFKKQAWANTIKTILPYGIGALLFVWWYVTFQSPTTRYENFGVTSARYFQTQLRAYFHYMSMWFWPWDLNGDNLIFDFSRSWFDAWTMRAVAGHLCFIAVLFHHRKKFPAFNFGLIWFYVALLPHSSFIPIDEPVADRRVYLSLVGFSGGTLAVLLWFTEKFFSQQTKEKKLPWMIVATVLSLFIGTHVRNQTWANPEAFWQDVIRKGIFSSRAYNNLAAIYMGQGKLKPALNLLDACLRLQPHTTNCLVNKAVVLQALGNKEGAEQTLLAGLQLTPKEPFLNYNLAVLYFEKKEKEEQVKNLLEIADRETGYKNIRAKILLAKLYLKSNQTDKAKETLNSVLVLEPTSTEAQSLLKLSR